MKVDHMTHTSYSKSSKTRHQLCDKDVRRDFLCLLAFTNAASSLPLFKRFTILLFILENCSFKCDFNCDFSTLF